MKIKSFYLFVCAIALFFYAGESFCASFTAGDLYLAKTDGIYWVDDDNPASNYLFVSGGESDTNRKVTFSYKRGYVDHMFITDGANNNIIREYDADRNLIRSWTVPSLYYGEGITDIAADIQDGTTGYIYLSYAGYNVTGGIDRINLTTGAREPVYTAGGFNPRGIAFTITQPGQTDNLLMANQYWNGSIWELDPDTLTATVPVTFSYNNDAIYGFALGKNADGTTNGYAYLYKKYMREYYIPTATLTSSREYPATRSVDVRPNPSGATQYLATLHNVGGLTKYYGIRMLNVDTFNSTSIENNIFQNSWDIAYVQYGWDGFVPAQWTYIKNNKSNLSETWTDVQVDILYQLYVDASGSVTVNNEKWNSTATNFNTLGFWGVQHTIGQGWIDKYGFKHIYLDNNNSITTFDALIFDEEWEYIATAGYSSLFGQAFNADWTKDDIDALYSLYLAQQGTVILSDDSVWFYTDTDYSQDGFWGTGKDIGDYWVDSKGNRHIFLGAGLTTYFPEPAAIPEPLSLFLTITGVTGFILKKRLLL